MTILCNAPFCTNLIKYKKSAYCNHHQVERQSKKIKAYKELLPLWATKRCKIHGLLRPSQTLKRLNKEQYICKLCQKSHRQPNAYSSPQALLNKKNKALIKRYGISLNDYNAILIKQNNSCAICKNHILNFDSKTGLLRKMATDHCHKSKKVRGILCFKCNIGLGSFQDNIELLENALEYLRLHK